MKGLNHINELEIIKDESDISKFIFDITEKKFQYLLENIDDLISILNKRFEFEYINENIFNNLLGYDYEDLQSNSFLNYVHSNDLIIVKKLLENCSRIFKAKQEIRIRNKKGNYGWFELKAKKFKDENRKIKILVILNDISKYKKMEKELIAADEEIKKIYHILPEIKFWSLFNPKKYEEAIHSSNDMLYNVIENIPHYIFWKDLELRYLGCNINYAKFIGVNYPEKIINTKDKDLSINEKIARELNEHEMRVISSNSAELHHEYKWELENGEIIWLDINRIPFHDSKGKILGILVTYDNITKRKNAEQTLIESEKRFRNLDKIKSELLTRASHELNTPLIAIKGFTELLMMKYHDTFDDEEKYIVKKIKDGSQRLEILIKKIIKTAELKSGLVELNLSRGNLSSIITSCVEELKKFADSRNISINLKLHKDLITYFDKDYISLTIIDIIRNAIKYTHLNGIITIRSEINDYFIIISISDTGIGFTKNEIKKIFKRFGKIERFGQGFNIISDGIGLSLYISKKIIQLHGGKIWVESRGRNQGSTFYIALPLKI